MNNKTINQLIKLYEDQITQLEIMSKIELGDDVIDEINKLKNALEKETQKQLLTEIMNDDAKDGLYGKQTVVEWLQWALEHTILTHEQVMQTIGLFEQAKEMEKQQIIDTYKKAQVLMVMDSSKQAEQYYNETYGGNK